MGSKKITPRLFAKAMAIINAADPRDRTACMDALNEANAIVGIAPRKSPRANPHQQEDKANG